MRTTAVKRLATARNHRERAAAKREPARRTSDQFADLRPMYLEDALRHEVRGAERCGNIPRAVRDVALRLVPSWTGGYASLVDTARAIAQASCAPNEGPAHAASAGTPAIVSLAVSGPQPKMTP